MKEDHTWVPTFPYENIEERMKQWKVERGFRYSEDRTIRASPMPFSGSLPLSVTSLPVGMLSSAHLSLSSLSSAYLSSIPLVPLALGHLIKPLLHAGLVSLPSNSIQTQHCCLRPESSPTRHTIFSCLAHGSPVKLDARWVSLLLFV